MKNPCAGLSLVELLVAMAIASLAGSMILQMVISFQSRILAELGRNKLQDRAERLIRFLSCDIREAAFLLGAEPRVADGAVLALVHDSLPGTPLEELPFAILPADVAGDDDLLTIVKTVSFSPRLALAQPGLAGETLLVLSRRPNRSPGSTRELLPAPEAISHLVLDNHRACYAVQHADLTLQLVQPLAEHAPAATEVLGVRALTYLLEPHAGSKRLRRDDFTSREVLDDAVDGLQFEYLLDDGSLVSQPAGPGEIRGVRISLLVRDVRPDRGYVNDTVYPLGNHSYGPFRDHFRRSLVTELVEVKNHGLP
jgi:prepilin-type N-terminal cleavage/methylation domain-containing protein